MEKLLNPYDKENMRKAVLRHEETFREQVNELHRLYRTQKKLMKDHAAAHQHGTSNPSWNNDSRARKFVDRYNFTKAGENSGIIEGGDDLELTLGPTSYSQKKIKAAEPGTSLSGFGPGFSTSSSSSGSTSCMKKTKQNNERLDNSYWITFSRFLA